MPRTDRRPRMFRLGFVFVILTCLRPADCFSQLENPVYVDDSPLAWELFQRAEDQAQANIAEAVRLYQELLDDYGLKLIPVGPAEQDRLYSVRSRVLRALQSNEELLTRYQLIEQAEAERMFAAGELAQLALTRSLTQAGLEALLQLGQRELEAARFHAALKLLRQAESHPSLNERAAAHARFMMGVAAHYLGDARLQDAAREQLVALGRTGEAFLAELDRITANPIAGGPVASVSPIDNDVPFELDDLVAQEIWSKELPKTLFRRHYANSPLLDRDRSFAVNRRRRDIDIATVAVAATESAVYTNEGHIVRAFDRFTGYELWPAPHVERHDTTVEKTELDEVGDLNLIAVEGDALVTLTGHADADGRSSNGHILCLDARTGERRWATDVDHMLSEEEYDGLYPYGAPIIAEGRVYCLARKQSTQTLVATYLIAFDLEDGSPVWGRHIASSALIRMRHTRPFSIPVYDRGNVLVATAVGAVCSVDALTGEITWLRVHRPPITESPQIRRPWELSSPVVTPRGIMAIQPNDRRVMLLDRDTGQMIESYPIGTSEGWGSPKYLLAGDRFVFAVGADVRAFHIDNLERSLWRVPSEGVGSAVADGTARSAAGDDRHVELAGRVQVTTGALVVPTSEGLKLVDLETGHEEQRLAITSVVIPLAVDSQLFVAGADSLDAYMPFGTAEKILRDRLAAKPDELDPALSLLRLGIRVRHLDLTLEAAEIARTTLSSRPEGAVTDAGRETLFAMLLEAARLGLGGTGAAGERVHAMLRQVAVTPAQQVEQLLAYGAWCAGGDPTRPGTPQKLREAVEAYQTIFDHPPLASTEREHDGVSKSARQWAIDRVDQLIEAHGRAVYAPQEDYAQFELAQLTDPAGGQGAATLGALRELAARYPFADAAGTAALHGARVLQDARLHRDALTLLETVYASVPAGRQPASARLLGEMVRLSEMMGWHDHARALLEHASRAHAGMALVLDEGSRDPLVWLELLGAARELPPRIGPQRGAAEVVAGAVVSGQDDWIAHAGQRFLLVHNNDTLSALRSTDLKEAWTSQIGAANWLMLGEHDGAAILWPRPPIQTPRAVAVDLADGTLRWTSPHLEQFVRQVEDPVRRDRGGVELMPDGQPFNPAEVLPFITGDRLLMVRRTGEVYAVDLDDGQPLVTVAGRTIDEVHDAHVTDLGIVLIGQGTAMGGRTAGPGRVPIIVLVDATTGDVLLRMEPTGATGVLWSALTPMDELVYGTEAGVELVSLLTGERRWRQRGPAAESTRNGWPVDTHVLVESAAGSVRAISRATGNITEAFHRPRSALGGESSPLQDIVLDRGRIFAQFADGIVRVSEEGQVLGADSISHERDYRWLLPARDRYVLVSKFGTRQIDGRTKHFYRIYTLSENCAVTQDGLELEPLDESIREALLVDGWLFLSTGAATIAVPMPVK